MKNIELNNKKTAAYIFEAVVVGSGSAAFNAALSLYCEGVTDIAIVCEGINMGTSRNTGSDKQTYYKLGMSGAPDSPMEMAKDLFSGGCVDGDIAYAEAVNSVRSFIRLNELGVKFPTNRYGEFVGYKTDHDTRSRAASVGPLTSRLMTECLEKAVRERNIKIYDSCFAIEIIKRNERAAALIALDKTNNCAPVVFGFDNIILATGGPAGMYADSVYPECHKGASGLAFEAGAKGRNLTEWQYGLASLHPRWNVSGTYMQVLPSVVSVDSNGVEREFLSDYFADRGKGTSVLFKKGYEWPFDCSKAKNGSSVVDLLVWYETSILGRKVYLDYTRNPDKADELDYSSLDSEAREYLEGVGACFGKPIDRLKHMNMPAYELYLSRGVDLACERLEIALCAQHNNGGVSVDEWWQSSVEGLFVAGEAAGTHGVKRPGGSALNAGQVGSLRAAQYIAAHCRNKKTSLEELEKLTANALDRLEKSRKSMISDFSNTEKYHKSFAEKMSKCAGAIRNIDGIRKLSAAVTDFLMNFDENVRVSGESELYKAYSLRDTLVSQRVYLYAMENYVHEGGASRGSAIYLENITDFNSVFEFDEADTALLSRIQEIINDGYTARAEWRDVHPLPDGGGIFELVWKDFMAGRIFE